MRGIAILSLTAALTACAAPEPYHPSPRTQQQLGLLLNGKVAGRPISC
nr:hypothetical protein [Sphingomonas sp.]